MLKYILMFYSVYWWDAILPRYAKWSDVIKCLNLKLNCEIDLMLYQMSQVYLQMGIVVPDYNF